MRGTQKVRTQLSKPMGWTGWFVLWEMNRHHSKLTDWGLAHVAVNPGDTVLDVGCGGGRTISKLAKLASKGKVFGVDYSEESVAASRRKNRQPVGAGRVKILEAAVSRLPFAGGTFDLVTAIETHFFWPDLNADVREVFRVTKAGGRFMIIAEVYKGATTMAGRVAEKYVAVSGMTLLTPDEHRGLLANAGFAEVEVDVSEAKGWICAIGKK